MIRVVLAVALTAAACGTQSSQVEAPPLVTSAPTTAPTTAPSTSEATAPSAVPVVEPAIVEQVDCPAELASGSVACGQAAVPLDRYDPDAGTTVITLATMTGTDDSHTTPAAVLQGGPGGSSSELAGWFPRQPFTQVFVDQRGTGFLGADLDCREFDDALVDALELPSDPADEVLAGAVAACAARLADDPVLRSADSATHAADVAAVMAALGYEQWVAYGVSYGTTIGLELLRTPPAGLAGVVLDGVYPPELDVDAAVGFSATRALAEVDEACGADPDCGPDDLVERVDALIARLDAEPVTVEIDGADLGADRDLTVVLDGRRFAELAFLLLYGESRLRFLPAVVAGLEQGDARAARWLVVEGGRVLLSSWGANDEGTYYAVQCRDRLPFTDGLPDDVGAFAAANVGALLGTSCEPWDREPAPAGAGEPVTSDLPALLLSGRFDPITPPEFAEQAAAGLSSATIVTQDGRGHGIWYGDDCIAAIVTAFVADPGAALDTSCAATGPEVDWARP